VPKIEEKPVPVESWNIEKVIYDEVLNMCVEDFNGKSKIHDYGCRFLTDIIQRIPGLAKCRINVSLRS
jgi:hypothetical protein